MMMMQRLIRIARAPRQRRGVSSVLAMMFLVIFGSLGAAMAVVAQGNLRTADSALKVSRAMSAAETGLAFATRRLATEGKRFVVLKGVIDADYAEKVWLGTYDSADVTILPAQGYVGDPAPAGLIAAIRDAHLADSHDFVAEAGDGSLPTLDDTNGVLRVRPIRVASTTDEPDPPYFRLKYELVANEPMVRITSQGVDGDITRTLQLDFRIDKKIEYAVISPNRIMIGKNVRVEGPLGSRYGVVAAELVNDNGDPLVMRSDFYYLSSTLNDNLDVLFAQIEAHDTDGDNRLRPDHPAESVGVAAYAGILVDYDGNEYVDDFDLFLAYYDDALGNSDGSVLYDPILAGGGTDEFNDDEQLASLIDSAVPDRNGDDVVDAADTALGYLDGKINANDIYAKVRGELAFAVAQSAWEAAHGDSYQTVVNGSIVPSDEDTSAVAFQVPDEDLLEITTAMMDASQTWFYAEAQTGADFGDETTGQVQAQIAAGGTFTPAGGNWESVPFGSSGAYDHYDRPVYENMKFTNAVIPKGTNALFRNCTFVGVTYLETETDCDNENWNYAGALEPTGTPPLYEPRFPGLEAEASGVPVADTRLESNNIRFDGCTFIGSISGDKPNEYTHWRNKIQFTGATRFFSDPSDPDIAGQPDEAAIRTDLGNLSSELPELQKSSILLPGWSVDVGSFDNDVSSGTVNLRGTVVAGILDVRGTVDVFGTLMMTFRPTEGVGPLYYGGQLDAFNTTIGYFGPDDGDGEGTDPTAPGFPGFGEITLRYNEDAKLPDGIPWSIRVDPVPETYIEGGSM